MTRFNPVNLKEDFPKLEEKLLKDWDEKGINKDYLSRNQDSDRYYSFLDGPITANNPMGVHHAWGRTYKDLWQRYFNMKGFKQRFQNGFDCQGLWVEVEVEKELGIKTKKDIENLVPGDRKASIAKFVDLCKKRVEKYSTVQTEQSKRLGYLMDWDNSYFTLSENNNYMIWHFLKVCDENGWIYKGNDVVPWCPRCETAISQHEILTEDYKDVTHRSIYFKLPIEGRENEYLLVWTTTPWTLPANTAVAVDERLEYTLVKRAEDKFWVVKDLVQKVFSQEPGEVVETVKGSELVGLKYKAPFDSLPIVKEALEENDNMHRVVATDPLLMPITTEEGTGLVHTSTSTGEEDHRLGKKLGLPVIPAIDDTACYLEGYGDLSGKNAKDNPDLIFDYLKGSGEDWIFAIVPYKHRYPACWRCKSELVWKVTDEWYIAMDLPSKAKGSSDKTLRQRMIEVTKKIRWIPEFGLERELDWLTNMHDWLISKKNRFWGLALPIWECTDCGIFEVVGSEEELKEKAVSGWADFEGKTPHKPQIDEVKIKCPKCGKEIQRIEPVGNPWLDAGIVAFSTISKNNKACLFEGSSEKPAYLDDKEEWAKWFPADFITESFPGQFKNWFYSLIAMSSVLEDRPPFKTVLGFATLLAESGKPMHKSLGNSIEFSEGADKIGVDVMRWMYLRQNPSDNLLFGYKTADEIRRRFHLKLWNIYNFFVTYANIDDFDPDKKGKKDSNNILDKWLIVRFNQMLTNVTSFIENYNSTRAAMEIEEFVDDFSNWYIRRSRDRVGFSVEETGDKNSFYATTYFVLTNLVKVLAPFTPFMAEEMYLNLTKEKSVHLSDWPDVGEKLTDEYLKLLSEMAKARQLAEKGHALRKEKEIVVKQPLLALKADLTDKIENESIVELLKDELNVKSVVFEKGAVLELDTNITPELKEEAMARDLIRKIQDERKNMNLCLTQSSSVTTTWLPKNNNLVQKIKSKTCSKDLNLGEEFKVEVAS